MFTCLTGSHLSCFNDEQGTTILPNDHHFVILTNWPKLSNPKKYISDHMFYSFRFQQILKTPANSSLEFKSNKHCWEKNNIMKFGWVVIQMMKTSNDLIYALDIGYQTMQCPSLSWSSCLEELHNLRKITWTEKKTFENILLHDRMTNPS